MICLLSRSLFLLSSQKDGKPVSEKFPVIIYLHEYAYPTGWSRNIKPIIDGFTEKGFAVVFFDQIGFGTRVEEGTLFYERYPHWSKMGRMVDDTKAMIDALEKMNIIDKDRIYLAGYALGGTVGLYTAAMDERVGGVISICGFTPMRLDTADKGTEGIRAYSHLHGLLPRLGFFVGNESRIPYDFHEITASIAPRKILIIVPQLDRDATLEDVKLCTDEAKKVYKLFGAEKNVTLDAPYNYNIFSKDMQKTVFDWAGENF